MHQLLPIDPTERVQGFLAVPAHELTRLGGAAAAGGAAGGAEAPEEGALAEEGAEAAGTAEGDALLLITRDGFIKKTPLAAFANIQARGLTAITLGDGDELLRALRCPGGGHRGGRPARTAIIASARGQAVRFSIEDEALRPTGRMSRGVRAMVMREGDVLVDADLIGYEGEGGAGGAEAEGGDDDSESFLLAVTAKGYGKRVPTAAFRVQGRGGRGSIAIKFRKADKGDADADRLVALRRCRASDEVLLSTAKGTAVRQAVREISEQSRTATGVLLQRLDAHDSVANVAVLTGSDADEAEPEVPEVAEAESLAAQ